MEVDCVLAPVDASERAQDSAEYAVAVATTYDATLHLLHVVDETTVDRIADGDVAGRSVAKEQRAVTEAVTQHLAAAGHAERLEQSTAAGFSPRSLRQSPGSVILDVAEDVDADFLVVPRDDDDPETAIGKAAVYVVEYASQPVLSV